MRNLYRMSQSKERIKYHKFNRVACSTVDQTTGCRLYFCTQDGVFSTCIEKEEEPQQGGNFVPVGKCEQLLSADDDFEYMEIEDFIAIEHLVLNNELVFASSNGKVFSYQLATGDLEEVTHCQNGIRAMGWSPDQELVVFVDGSLNVVTMIGSAYEAIGEVQLTEDTFGDRQFMSVGWGKKETQFHGSEGKAAAKKPRHEDDDYGTPGDGGGGGSNDTPGRVAISWRADGELFAVSFTAPFGQQAFKVFNKEGALQFTSERCSGLGSLIAWRPSGNWIAIPQLQQRGERYTIGLFEKNGLRHQEIPLSIDACEGVAWLDWSPDSDVLAVQWAGEAGTFIDLYVMGNYHWYLKQSLAYETKKICSVQWDQRFSAGKTLHILTNEDDEYFEYEQVRFDFRIDRSAGDDGAMVAVIDGKRLLLTNFAHAVIPPPMCAYTVEQEHPINAVGYIRSPGRWIVNRTDISCNAFFTVDSRNVMSLYDVDFGDPQSIGPSNGMTPLKGAKLLMKMDICKRLLDPGQSTQSHWLWLNPDHMLLADGSVCCVLRIVPGEKCRFSAIDSCVCFKEATLAGWNSTEPLDDIVCIEAFSPHVALVAYASGQVGEIAELRAEQPVLRPHSILPEPCQQLLVAREGEGRAELFAFSPNRRTLYRNGKLLANEVTSALLTTSYLLLTTISELKFVPLALDTIVGERRIERGSKLVTVVPGSSRTVFQLPRGNLEAIYPRVLSLNLIAQHLEMSEYCKAFDIMRKERINLNLLVDHDAGLFVQLLRTHFLPQISNVHWLNLFITDLAPQDVCRTMYESNYPNRKDGALTLPDGYSVDGKVSFICDRLLEAMDPAPTVLTLPKITCYVKQGQLEQALALIWTLKHEQRLDEAADEALRYLLYLVEVNTLYDVALGMYDFGLVLFVATKSQKDPKEYLPFLNELKRMEEDYRKYRIDCHLKRYDRALGHIARYEADDERFKEALDLTISHELYPTAVDCYRNRNEGYYRTVCEHYGDHLRKAGKQAEASLMYERAHNFQQAIASARHALDWRRCARLTARHTPDDAARVLRSLVPALVEAGDHEAAATIAADHLRDSRLAVDCLLKDHRYERAMQVVSGSDDVPLQDLVRSALHQYLATFVVAIVAEREQFLRHKNRLLVVREERSKASQRQSNGQDDGDVEMDCGDCDLFSDSSTIASSRHTSSSGRSGKSHRSSKNRRKHERKLQNLKEGNPFEDIALVDALHTLVQRVCSVDRQRHIRSTCQVAVELSYDEEARILQREYGALFQLVRYSLDAIWIPEMIVPGLPPSTSGGQQDEQTGSEAQATLSTALSPADLVQAQNTQRYALIKPHQRYKPDIQMIPWQWDILK
ncbi:elongator complex protein 1 [Anopheles cruzii]|uniref:elongator complex protein 1 n=1 Tax=Anopheles cruzii TaxID=68878 RepID=UPI0022EC6278|nr:elongator complex protein 1 [Anopheles cruzii]